MGVHGLWNLISGCGQPVSLEQMRGKVLAVDVSVWLHQTAKGFRNKHGQPLLNAHILGLFHRISKLLSYNIKPIFVFDGGVPALKKQIIMNRRKKQASAQKNAEKVSKDLLTCYIENESLNPQGSKSERQPKAIATKSKCDEEDIFKLPASVPLDEILEEDYSSLPATDSERSFDSDGTSFGDIHSINLEESVFNNLPKVEQLEILNDIISTRKQNSWKQLDSMPQNSESFSDFQMKRLLKRRQVQQKLENVREEMGKESHEEMTFTKLKDKMSEYSVIINEKVSYTDALHFIMLKNKKLSPCKSNLSTSPSLKSSSELNSDSSLINDMSLCISQENILSGPCTGNTSDLEGKSNDMISSNSKRIDSCTDQLTQSEILHIIKDSDNSHSVMSKSESPIDNTSFMIPKFEQNSNIPAKKNKSAEYANDYHLNSLVGNSDSIKEKDEIMNQEITNDPDFPLNFEEPDDIKEVVNYSSIKGQTKENSDEVLCTYVQDYVDHDHSSNSSLESVLSCEADIYELAHNPVNNISGGESKSSIESGDKEEKQRVIDENGAQSVCADVTELPFSEEKLLEAHVPNIIQKSDEAVILKDVSAILKKGMKIHSQKTSAETALGKNERSAQNITDKMQNDVMELLKLFGIPYIIAPLEAESQCAFFDMNNISDGTITDDSDVWLFGGTTVYKNFFNQKVEILKYEMKEIMNQFNSQLNREKMISIAMFTGSDYTDGIKAVGPVTAMEILSEFPGSCMDSLKAISEWWKKYHDVKDDQNLNPIKKKLKNLHLPSRFPSQAVINSYLHPEVNGSLEKFSWGQLKIEGICEFTLSKLGWTYEKTKQFLQPIIKAKDSRNVQSLIKYHFNPVSRDSEKMMSNRLKRVLNKNNDSILHETNSGIVASMKKGKTPLSAREKLNIARKRKAAAILKKEETRSTISKIPKVSKKLCLSESSDSD